MNNGQNAVAHRGMTDDQVELVKQTVCKGTTDNELALFLHQCQRTGLDPFARQIHAVKRKSKDDDGKWVETLSIQIGIDGFRLVAQRTGEYLGQVGPFWSDGKLYPVFNANGLKIGEDLRWLDAWPEDGPPKLAKVGVRRKGFTEPLWAVARHASYVQTKAIWQNNQVVGHEPNRMWATMPDVMLAKCAEGLAIRKAFPHELSGLYSPEEIRDEQESQQVQPPQQLAAPSPRPNKKQMGEKIIAEAQAARTPRPIEEDVRDFDSILTKEGVIESGELIDYIERDNGERLGTIIQREKVRAACKKFALNHRKFAREILEAPDAVTLIGLYDSLLRADGLAEAGELEASLLEQFEAHGAIDTWPDAIAPKVVEACKYFARHARKAMAATVAQSTVAV